MPFIELNSKQRRALLNELIDESSDDELLSMARTILTRARINLPKSHQQRLEAHAATTFKMKKDGPARPSKVTFRPSPFPSEDDE